jgi:hypothetical protein
VLVTPWSIGNGLVPSAGVSRTAMHVHGALCTKFREAPLNAGEADEVETHVVVQ